jgi:type III restriction enzyme
MSISKKKYLLFQNHTNIVLVKDTLYHIEAKLARRAGLKGPTGCGKTIMVSDYIMAVSQALKGNVAFVLLTIGDGNLPDQAKASFLNSLLYSGINVYDIKESLTTCSEGIKNCVIVAGWEELNRHDNKTGKRTNIVMRESENTNFPDLCKLTKNNNIPIIVIIDESHDTSDTASSKDIIELISPAYILEVSATLRGNCDWVHTITYAEVVKEEMVKDSVHTITFPHLAEGVREAANKLLELLDLAKRAGAKFFPKVLVFLPNDNDSSNELKVIIDILHDEYGWTEGKDIKIVLSKHKTKGWEACKGVAGNMDETKFLITKEAISTGVDTTSVSIILQARPGKSESAKMQKIGRGFRMPEQKYYSKEFEKLNTLYYIVDQSLIADLSWDGVEEIKHLQKCTSYIRKEFIELAASIVLAGSYYERKVPFFEEDTLAFEKLFRIPFLDKLEGWQDKFNLDTVYTFQTNDGLWNYDTHEHKSLTSISSNANKDDIRLIFNKKMRSMLNHLWKHIDIIRDAVREYMEQKSGDVVSADDVMTFTLNNIIALQSLIGDTIDEVSIEDDNKRVSVSFDYTPKHTIEFIRDPDESERKETKKCLYQPYFQDGKHKSSAENRFANDLDDDSSYIGRNITFWLKNLDSKYGESFSLTYPGIDKDKTFYPDFITKLKDGRIGIFEVKDGDLDRETDNKMDALISEFRSQPNILCGIVRFENGLWSLYRGNGKERLQDLMHRHLSVPVNSGSLVAVSAI